MGLTVPKPKPTVLLTRPLAQSKQFEQSLRDGGFDGPIVISPLIEISAAPVDCDLSEFDGVIFTSRNAVDFAPVSSIHAWCVGDKTAEKARRFGWDATSADGDADALVATIARSKPEGKLVHLRGEHSRGDVATRLNQAGIKTYERVVYRQTEMPLSAEAQALLSGERPVIVPLFSPRSAVLLRKQSRFSTGVSSVVMSVAVANEIQNVGIGTIILAPKTTASAMLESTLSLIDAA